MAGAVAFQQRLGASSSAYAHCIHSFGRTALDHSPDSAGSSEVGTVETHHVSRSTGPMHRSSAVDSSRSALVQSAAHSSAVGEDVVVEGPLL